MPEATHHRDPINHEEARSDLIDAMANYLHVLDRVEEEGEFAGMALDKELDIILNMAIAHWTEERTAIPGSYEYREITDYS